MDKPILGHHTSSRFNEELEDVHRRFLAMGSLVEQQLIDATRALVRLDRARADEVIARDRQVNAAEVAIDEECSQILARRQPAAGDLRLVYSVIKSITDLERIGDEARKIARMAHELAMQEHIHAHLREVERLSRQASGMVRSALDAFARMDAEAALSAAQQDCAVDLEYKALMRKYITLMMEDPRTISRVDGHHLVRACTGAHR